jgi:hypothetical protein
LPSNGNGNGRHTNQVLPQVKKWVKEGSRVMTDDATIYRG